NQQPPQDPSSTNPDNPGEGELEANPNQPQAQNGNANQPRPINPADLKNEETGYSPSEARRKLKALSDENLEIRPIFGPVQAEKYKNW
ncbi:MAG: hypothetical protein HKN23_09250, partial [Verrucomicrobiales bacterium]|nr:hypothetical protein [Verrucomicrobiales bacterium]